MWGIGSGRGGVGGVEQEREKREGAREGGRRVLREGGGMALKILCLKLMPLAQVCLCV